MSSNASRRKSDSGHIDSKPGTSRSGLPSRWTRVEPHSKTYAFLRHDQEGEVLRVDRVERWPLEQAASGCILEQDPLSTCARRWSARIGCSASLSDSQHLPPKRRDFLPGTAREPCAVVRVQRRLPEAGAAGVRDPVDPERCRVIAAVTTPAARRIRG